MNQTLILFPLLAMFALVVMVAVTMFRRRVAFYKSNRVHPQKTATSAQMAAVMPDQRAPDNFRNLFELPVMFYVAVLTLYVTQLVILPQVVLAWIYVAARYTHSYIHCTSNVVMRRFYAFLVSCLTLLAMWIVLAIQLLTKA
ncbi:MAG: MAPEG family protein [Burkholderiales bacterium]|nr:MAPEG family protein [Burkholderiales bacterium]